VTLYVDDETLKRVRNAAAMAGMSMSAWLTKLVRERTENEWPREAIELVGAWRDMPDAERLRAQQPEDLPRERF
jgi:hypothetical protein